MPELQEIFSQVTEALGAADRGQKILCEKIASQSKEIERLKATKDCSESFKGLVDKLASCDVVDDLHAVYLKSNVTDANVNEFITKLANVIAPAKTAKMSPYEVSNIPVVGKTEPADKELEACNQRLMALYGK
jgi:hypothetical protein